MEVDVDKLVNDMCTELASHAFKTIDTNDTHACLVAAGVVLRLAEPVRQRLKDQAGEIERLRQAARRNDDEAK